jgi:hypothetical protein
MTTADLPLLNVISVAKNDELNDPLAMRREVKSVYERIW